MKIMTIAHGHPALHKGGGEVAAYALHTLHKEAGHESVFVGWGGFPKEHDQPVKQLAADDYLLYTQGEFFNFTSASSNLFDGLGPLLRKFRPDVVHLHHYVHIGIDIAALIKQTLPKAKVVLTLHEYLAICMNNGQMLTKQGELCSGATPSRCTLCFPHLSQEQFFMRSLSIKASFSWVDHFLSPSKFLRQKYIEWGLPESSISVIENPLPHVKPGEHGVKPAPKGNEPWVLGYFGQVNYYKGLDTILDGIKLARDKGINVTLRVHGNLSNVTNDNYMDELQNKLEKFGSFVQFLGPYAQTQLHELMKECHFLVMGSRWYENSPVVIQESIAAMRPIIAPAIGGMLEKAEGLGVFFAHQSSESLAERLGQLSPSQYQELCKVAEEKANAQTEAVQKNYQEVLSCYQFNKQMARLADRFSGA